VIPKAVSAFNASALYFEQNPAAPIRTLDQKVLQALSKTAGKDNDKSSKNKCIVHGSPTHTLHPMELYLSQCKGNVAPASYGGFTKIFQK
jgi:hypothetical protein